MWECVCVLCKGAREWIHLHPTSLMIKVCNVKKLCKYAICITFLSTAFWDSDCIASSSAPNTFCVLPTPLFPDEMI